MKPPTVMAIGWVWRPQMAAHRSPASFFMRRARRTTSGAVLASGTTLADAEQIGRHQHVGVKDMAVEHLAVKVELAQQHGLFGGLDAERLLGGAQRGGGVPDGANAADARGDVRRLGVRAAAEHGLEETRRLGNLQVDTA